MTLTRFRLGMWVVMLVTLISMGFTWSSALAGTPLLAGYYWLVAICVEFALWLVGELAYAPKLVVSQSPTAKATIASKLDPVNDRIYTDLINTLLALGQSKRDAIALATEVMTHNPDSLETAIKLALHSPPTLPKP